MKIKIVSFENSENENFDRIESKIFLPHTKHRQFHKLLFPRRLSSKNIFKICKPGTKTFGWIPAAIKSLADGLGSQHGASRDNNIWSYFWWYSGLSFLTVKTIYKLKITFYWNFSKNLSAYILKEKIIFAISSVLRFVPYQVISRTT